MGEAWRHRRTCNDLGFGIGERDTSREVEFDPHKAHVGFGTLYSFGSSAVGPGRLELSHWSMASDSTICLLLLISHSLASLATRIANLDADRVEQSKYSKLFLPSQSGSLILGNYKSLGCDSSMVLVLSSTFLFRTYLSDTHFSTFVSHPLR